MPKSDSPTYPDLLSPETIRQLLVDRARFQAITPKVLMAVRVREMADSAAHGKRKSAKVII